MENREIDKTVAEKVMGWEVKGFNGYGSPFVDRYGNNGEYPFSPSTDITDAWLVVEKLRKENDYWFELGTDESFSLKYKCYFQLDDMESVAIAETAPMAICLAALKSAGVEV